MAKKFDGEVDYYLHDGIDEVFDEKGQSFLALRKVQWCSKGAEPDSSKAKLEIRKWVASPDGGKDIANKGCAFLTEEGPHELTKVLVKNGYGKTKDLLLEIKKRDDFKESVENLYTDDEKSDGIYFDARSALLD